MTALSDFLMNGIGFVLVALLLVAVAATFNRRAAAYEPPMRRRPVRKLPRILFCLDCEANVEPDRHGRCPRCLSSSLVSRRQGVRFPRPA